MNKYIKYIGVLIVSLFCNPLHAQIEIESCSGYYYNYVSPLSPKVVEGIEIDEIVYDLRGDVALVTTAQKKCTGEIIIPEQLIYNNKHYTVSTILPFAFVDCKELTHIELPNSIQEIGAGAFACCINLKSIKLPNSLQNLFEATFWNCFSLQEITLPETLETIDNATFTHCNSLETIHIPKNVKSINIMFSGHFRTCKNLKEITVSPENEHYASHNGILFDKAKKTLLVYPPNKTYKKSDIPTSVSAIGKYSFERSGISTEITLPPNIKQIYERAFYESNIEKIILPDTLDFIGAYAFADCKKLREIKMPKHISECYEDKFAGNILSCLKIGEAAFLGCENLTSIDLPDNVEILPRYELFTRCFNLTKVGLPKHLKRFGDRKTSYFLGCKKLESITIPSSVSYINIAGFYLHHNDTIIWWPEDGSFEEFKEITLQWLTPVPLDIQQGGSTYWGWGKKPPNHFGIDAETCIIRVPKGTKELYETTEGWREFKNIVEY